MAVVRYCLQVAEYTADDYRWCHLASGIKMLEGRPEF